MKTEIVSLQMEDAGAVCAPFFFCTVCGKRIKDATKAWVYYCVANNGSPEKPSFVPVTAHAACAYPERDGKRYIHPIDRHYVCSWPLAGFLRHLLHNRGLDVNSPSQLKKLRETGLSMEVV